VITIAWNAHPLSRRVLKSNRAAYEEFERDGLVVAAGEVRLGPDGVRSTRSRRFAKPESCRQPENIAKY
jgi:hypothetical protein